MRPLSFAPGRAIGETAAKAVGLAKAVDWRRAAKVAAKVGEALPSPGDGPVKIALKLIGAIDGAAGALDLAPDDAAEAIARRRGGVRHDGASSLVRAVANGPDGSDGWPLVSRRPLATDAVLYEWRHPEHGRAWALSYGREGLYWSPSAWLEAPLSAVVACLWAAYGGRARLEVDREGRLTLGRARGLGGSLSGAGLARVAELEAERALAAKHGEGLVCLLAGPPGTGKSTTVAGLAERLGASLLVVGASAMREPGLRALAWAERHLCPGVVLLDDIERDMLGDVGQLLAWAQGRSERAGVVTALSVNDRSQLPDALTREGRVDEIVLTEAPGAAEREAVLRALCDRMGVAPGLDLSAVVEATEGRGEAALVDAARRLRDRPVERVVEQIKRRRAIEAAGG